MNKVESTLQGFHLELGVQAVHEGDLVFGAELDLADPRGLKDASAGVRVGIELNAVGVDVAVNHNPGAAANLTLQALGISHGSIRQRTAVYSNPEDVKSLAVRENAKLRQFALQHIDYCQG
eukprot:scaffold33536_cov43-Prasinocladus_malaysianus.AAC.1